MVGVLLFLFLLLSYVIVKSAPSLYPNFPLSPCNKMFMKERGASMLNSGDLFHILYIVIYGQLLAGLELNAKY